MNELRWQQIVKKYQVLALCKSHWIRTLEAGYGSYHWRQAVVAKTANIICTYDTADGEDVVRRSFTSGFRRCKKWKVQRHKQLWQPDKKQSMTAISFRKTAYILKM